MSWGDDDNDDDDVAEEKEVDLSRILTELILYAIVPFKCAIYFISVCSNEFWCF